MDRCGLEISQQSVEDIYQRSKSSSDEVKFVWAEAESGLNVLQMSIDHDECRSTVEGIQQETKCFYQLVVISDDNQLTKYQLSASRYQKNYEILRGSLPKIASVDMDEVRYFKYSLSAKTSYKALSFQLKTFHGDADLFVSREDQWP